MNNIEDSSYNSLSYFNLLFNNNLRENMVNIDFQIVDLSNNRTRPTRDISLLNTPEHILGERLYNNLMNTFNNNYTNTYYTNTYYTNVDLFDTSINNTYINNDTSMNNDLSFLEFTIPYVIIPNNEEMNRRDRLNRRVRRNSIRNYISTLLTNIEYSNTIDNFINETFESDKKKYKRVINEDSLIKLKVIKFQKKEAELMDLNIECPITKCNFNEGEEVIILPYNHCLNQIV